MNFRVIVTGAAVVAALAGCQSSSWNTAGQSKLGFGMFSRNTKDASPAESVRLVSDDRLRRSQAERGAAADSQSPALAGLRQQDGNADARLVLQRAHRAEADGQLAQAKALYQQVLELEPRHSLAHHRLAILADKQSEFTKAQEHYLTALSVNRNDPNLLSDLGYSFLLQNRPDESKYYLQQALEADPSHVRALNNLGLLHARQGDYDGALAIFRQAGPENEAQEKISQLFPDGRPVGDGSTFAANDRQPQVTPAAGASAWGDAEGNGVQPAGGAPFASQGGLNEFQPSPGPGPLPAAGVQPSGGATGGVFAPSGSDRSTESRPDSRQLPTDPLDMLEEWPPRRAQPDQPQRRAAPFPADGERTMNDTMGPSSQQSNDQFQFSDGREPVQTASATGDGSFDAGVVIHADARRAGVQLNPRQQAAMVGLNAGPGGIFPVSYESGGGAAPQSAAPHDAASPQPHDDQPQFGAGPTSHQPQALPPHVPQNFDPRQFESQPPGTAEDARSRTAARPLSPAGDYSEGSIPVIRDNSPSQQPTQPYSYPPPNQNYSQPDPPQYAPQPHGSGQTAPAGQFNPGNTYQPGPARR